MKFLLPILALVLLACPASAAEYTFNITSNGLTCGIPVMTKSKSELKYTATLKMHGGFGNGTITIVLADDAAGSNPVGIRNKSEVVPTYKEKATADLSFPAYHTSKLTAPYICFDMAGATSPSVNITVFDNNK